MSDSPSLFKNLEVEPGGLPRAEEATFHPHPARYINMRYVGLAILFVVLSAGWAAPWIAGERLVASIIGPVWFIMLILAFTENYKSFQIRGYALREKDISYRKGWLRFSLITIPFTRVQHSEITQGPIGRAFKLSTLNIYTAGGSASDLKIPGLDPDEAQRLRDFIAQKVGDDEQQ